LKTVGLEKEMDEDTTHTSNIAKNHRKRIKIDSIDDVLKSFNGSLDSSSDNEEMEPVDEVAQYMEAKISYPKGESLLRWWYNHSFMYKK